MNIAAKVGLFFLFNIILFKYGINADVLEIPRDIVEQIQNILEAFENWIIENQRIEINDKFIAYFKEFGKRIARILSLPSNNNIWWLWELSILSNSIDIFNQPIANWENHYEITKMNFTRLRVTQAIRLIKDQIKNYLKKDKKNKRFLGFLLCTKTDHKNQPIESIDPKLESLDEAIQEKFGNIKEDKVHFYTPQNLFFFDIILNEASILTLFTNCSAIKWIDYKEHLIQVYHEAMSVWVDKNEKYLELITYRKTLIDAVRISFFVQIKLLISIFIGYESKNDKQNIQYWDDLWKSVTSLVKKFKDFFHFDNDQNLKDMLQYFMDPKLEKFKDNKTDLFNIANEQSKCNNNLYNGTILKLGKFINNTKGLEALAKETFNKLNTYLKNIECLFEKFDFEISNIFYNIIPNKNT